MEGDIGTVALRRDRHQEELAVPPEPDGLRQPPGEGRGPRPLRFYLLAGAILAALGCLATLAELPLWRETPALATVNLIMSLAFILTGLLLRTEPGQCGVAWALILAGVFRSLDFIDAWNTGPWPVYAVVFGGIDRVFGAYAVLRYPRPALGRLQRIYILILAGWMVVSRSLVVVTIDRDVDGLPGVVLVADDHRERAAQRPLRDDREHRRRRSRGRRSSSSWSGGCWRPGAWTASSSPRSSPPAWPRWPPRRSPRWRRSSPTSRRARPAPSSPRASSMSCCRWRSWSR